MKITSLNNQKISNLLKLKNKKYRDKSQTFLVESENLVNEALKKGVVTQIITTEEKTYPVETYNVTYEIMKKLSMMITPSKIMAVCKYLVPNKIEGNILILDNLQDPGNLGTIIRSAIAFNFKTLILSENTVDIYNDKVIRSSEGMIFNINIIKTSLKGIIPKLKSDGFTIIGTDVEKGKDIKKLAKQKWAFVIGNEGNGISSDIKNLCDDFIYIKMNKTCESLNAAVASSIVMYEASHD